MIIAIRIAGLVKMPGSVEETLYRMRLRKKYAAVLLYDTFENRKLLINVRNFVAYGSISKHMLEKLIVARAQGIGGKKADTKKAIEEIEKKNINLAKIGIKPFFRLHPPRKGIDSKKHFGINKGVLGNNKEHIDKLVERML